MLVDISPGLFPPADAAPELLHPALWRAHQVARPRAAVCASGYPALDAQLPGGGWPAHALTELLLPHPGIGELRLLAPALAAVQAAGRSLMWFDPPARPCPWTLAALGLDLRQLVLVRPADQPPPAPAGGRGGARRPPAAPDVLWALEQALKSGHVGAVLAWLPAQVRPESLRRLQLAAQAHDGPAWVLRDAAVHTRASPAPLRLQLTPAAPDELWLHIVKRRGPPPLQPLRLALAPVLAAPARARALRGVGVPGNRGMPVAVPVQPSASPAASA